MFNVNVKYGDADINISFPCTNNELYAKLAELHVPDEKKSQVQIFVRDIDYPELECLKNNFYDPDELNHLAQRLDSFDANEQKKFDAVAAMNQTNSIRELINLTYNMHYYTLIQDMSNFAEIGRIHILTREGGISVDEAKEMDFEKIGRELIESGTGKLTKYGLLFTNADLTYEKPYIGKSIPYFYYESGRPISMEIGYNGNKNYVYLPDSDLAIDRAVHRMGAKSVQDCELKCDAVSIENEAIVERLKDIFNNEGIYSLNKAVSSVSKLPEWDLPKLNAVIGYAGVSDAESVSKLADNLREFVVIPEAVSFEDVGRYWIEDSDEYELSIELEDFFLFEQFGEQIANDHNGKFVDGDIFVCIDDGRSLSEILGTEEQNNGMVMPGM